MTRTKYGKWRCEVHIQGASVPLGPYKSRSEAVKALEVADKIREGLISNQKSVDRTKFIERFRCKELDRLKAENREAMSAIKDSGVVR